MSDDEKMNFKKKTITLILVVTIASCLFIGYASADGKGLDPLTQIIKILTGIKVSINDLNASIDQLQQHYLTLNTSVLVPSYGNNQTVLPQVENQIYSGHIILKITEDIGQTVTLKVIAKNGDQRTILDKELHPGDSLDVDFVCQQLEFSMKNFWPGPRSLNINGVITYTSITDGAAWTPQPL
jgi:hypothetical protein